MPREAREVTKDEAVAALKDAAWTKPVPEESYVKAVDAVRSICTEVRPGEAALAADILGAIDLALGKPETIIHCILGSFGADWDLDGAVKLIGEAEKVGWVPDIFRHELAVLKDGKLHRFDVRAPEAAS